MEGTRTMTRTSLYSMMMMLPSILVAFASIMWTSSSWNVMMAFAFRPSYQLFGCCCRQNPFNCDSTNSHDPSSFIKKKSSNSIPLFIQQKHQQKHRKKTITHGFQLWSHRKHFDDDGDITLHEEVEEKFVTNENSRKELIWISLPDYYEDDYSKTGRTIRLLWKWKDVILGNGRDYFLPKPRALQELQQLLLQQNPSMEECSIVSNCARLDIFATITHNTNSSSTSSNSIHNNHNYDWEKQQISNVLSAQLHAWTTKSSSKSLTNSLLGNALDLPGMIVPINSKKTLEEMEMQKELNQHLIINSNVTEIVMHLCQVSCGLASRPNRPNRPVIFRPYSSRDAHILLQLKRTSAIISTTKNNNSGEKKNDKKKQRKFIQYIYKMALQAGKQVRSFSSAPLSRLRPYSNAKSMPPSELHQTCVDYVMEEIIYPTVDATVTTLSSWLTENDDKLPHHPIVELQKRLPPTSNDKVKKLIHQAFCQIRDTGQRMAEEDIQLLLANIQTLEQEDTNSILTK